MFIVVCVQLEALCDAVGFNEMSDSSISAACQSLCSSSASHFSFENCCIFAQRLLLPPVPWKFEFLAQWMIITLEQLWHPWKSVSCLLTLFIIFATLNNFSTDYK